MFSYFLRTASIGTLAKNAAALVTVIFAFCGSPVVHAQDGAQNGTDERLLACDKISDPAEKMQCFDAVVRSLQQADATPTTEPSSAQTPVSDTPAVTAPAAVVGVTAVATPAVAPDPKPAAAASPSAAQTPTAASEPEPAAEPQPATTTPAAASAAEPAAASQSEIPVPSPADAPVEAAVASATAAEDFGFEIKKDKTAEQTDAEKAPELKSLHAIVVSSQNVGDERFLVQLDNGQVWQENDGLYIGLPKVGTPVEITKGRFGGYRMKIGNANKRTPVKRIK